jgi:outer membrane receptor protein involved in Fe transport
LFELPAGPLQMALGASYRDEHYKFDNDTLSTQGRSFNDQALGIYPSGNVNAGYDVKEVYGELAVPIIQDGFIKELSLELGGRISDYSTTGTSYTYKALANFAPVDWLRFRGGYNRAERAPNIAELYLSPQQTFGVNLAGDPCSRANPLAFSANPANANGANVEAVCRILMAQTGDPSTAANYYAGAQSNSTFGFAFPTTRGNAALHPETADTWTAGVVISSPFASAWLSRLRLSVDYYNIKVNDAIGVQSVAVALRQCFDVGLNPLIASDPAAAAATAFCQNVPRNAGNGGLGNVTTTYVNNGRFQTDGIDAQLDWSAPVGPGTLSLNSQFSYLLHFKSAELPTDARVDYAGTQGPTGNGLNGQAFRWKLFSTLNYSIGGATLGLQWQHLPSIKNAAAVTNPANTTTGAPAYDIFHLNGSYALTDNMTIRAGVNNLFNKAPPITGQNLANVGPGPKPNLVGGNVGGLSYDDIGRTFFVGANMKF